MEIHYLARSPILRSACHTSHTLPRIIYKVRGDGPGVHFNIGLSDSEKEELDSLSLEALMATHKKAFSSGSSLYRGVNWDTEKQKWRACIKIGGKMKHLGYFLLEEDAARAYDRVAKEIHGRYVYIIFIMRITRHYAFKCCRLSISVCILSD
jgi:hypothetical protein